MDNFASCRSKLKALLDASTSTDLNEATTRLRYIDTLLRDCLNWHPEELAAEEYYAGEYIDYGLGSPSTEAILEAKREGVSFQLPAGVAGRQSVMLETAMEDHSTKSAVEQVLRYCQARGVPIAIICNGHQLLAFYASRQDGVPPLKGRAVAFSSLQEMYDNFATLWNNLSRDGMSERNLQRNLFGPNFKALPPPKLSDTISGYPGFRARSPQEADLKLIGSLLIQDLENNETISDTFIRQCYCSSGALSQYAMVSREILSSRYEAVGRATETQVDTVRNRRGVNPLLTAEMVSSAMSTRPVIVLGDVGVGKTMFIRHLVKVDAAAALESALVLYINFGDEPALETDLEAHVYRRITSQLLTNYSIDIAEASLVRSVYNAEINRFKKGIYGELEEDDPTAYRAAQRAMLQEHMSHHATHLRRTLEHLQGSARRSSVILLDNIDQRPAGFQERVFLIAQSLAATWPATVFVALRPSTFFESKSKGSLAAYQLRVFTVLPTRVDEVVERRLVYVRKLAGDGNEDLWPASLTISREDVVAYLDVLLRAFSTNEALKELLDNISGGNLRLALTYLSTFIGSGYVLTQRVLDVAREGHTYEIPMHEFLRAIIFGEFDYFDPSASEVCNLFDITTDDGREHFLLPIILAHVQRSGEGARTEGFVEAADIYRLAQSLGFSQEQVGPQLMRAFSKKLVESPPGKGSSGPYRITSIGSYMYRKMICSFVYLDAMVVDTPIVDIPARRQIADVSSIRERLDRGLKFVDYLTAQWDRLSPGALSPFDWISVRKAIFEDIDRARRGAERAAQRYRSAEHD